MVFSVPTNQNDDDNVHGKAISHTHKRETDRDNALVYSYCVAPGRFAIVLN